MSAGPQQDSSAASSEVESLLDELDDRARQSGEGARYAQRTPRFRYRHPATPLHWKRSDGLVIQSALHTRNLSVGGLGGIHSGELPRGASVTITLKQVGGAGVAIAGSIVYVQRCRSNWWSVGLKFDRPIKLSSYLREAP